MPERSSIKERLVRVACDISNRLRDVKEIEVTDAQQNADGLVLIDVRPEAERAVSMIPGAITAEHFEANRDSYRNHEPVAYCTAGYRSGVYAQKMNRTDASSNGDSGTFDSDNAAIKNLRGGILSWCQAGLPVMTPEGQPTNKVHVYSKSWNLLPEGFHGVWRQPKKGNIPDQSCVRFV